MKSGFKVLRSITATDASSLIADNSLVHTPPSACADLSGGEVATITIIAYSSGSTENDTFTIKLWGYRDNIAEYLATLTLTVGSSAFTKNPLNLNSAVTSGKFIDTIAIGTDNYNPTSVKLMELGKDQGNDRIAKLYISLFGISKLYAECTAASNIKPLTILYSASNLG